MFSKRAIRTWVRKLFRHAVRIVIRVLLCVCLGTVRCTGTNSLQSKKDGAEAVPLLKVMFAYDDGRAASC
jgi:hypothetical protein